MARMYNRAHVLGRLTAYNKKEATWQLITWTQQLRRSAPLTHHFAVIVLHAESELERIEVTTQTYTAMRRILHENPALAALPHTPGIEYEDKAELLTLKREARKLLQQAEQQQIQLEQAVEFVQNTPDISLSLADEYVSRALATLQELKIADTVQEQIQQVGPPLFQTTLETVTKSMHKLEVVTKETNDFIEELEVPQPTIPRSQSPEPAPRSFLDTFTENELLQVPYGMRYPEFPLKKKLKPMNAAYLRLLEGFHLLLRDSKWERGLYERFDEAELEKVSQKAAEFTKAEVMYLHFLHRYYTDSNGIDDAYLERIKGYLSVRFLKHELLRYIAEL